MGPVFYRELTCLPPHIHWFCPSLDDVPESPGPLNANKGPFIKIEDSPLKDIDQRRQQVLECLRLLGYDGEQVKIHQKWLIRRMDMQLGKCNACIIDYYESKRREIERLRQEYDDEPVDLLVSIWDKQDLERILRGLDNATKALDAAEPSQRAATVLDTASKFALFEALNCDAFLQDTNLVKTHLDKPMALVQTNKRLQVPGYVPAATYFLFDPDPSRHTWARLTWAGYRSNASKNDFDFAVRDPLARQLRSLSETVIDASVPERFWYGMQLIVKKLDKDLIAHSLLALEVDVCRLGLDHLQIPTPALRFLLQTIQAMLEVAPENFWDAMGAISPTTVIEQIFNNPQYDRYMELPEHGESVISARDDLLAWIQPFMASLKPSHQVQPCRSLTFQLLDRLQEERFAPRARSACERAGILVLKWALSSCNGANSSLGQVRRMVTTECLEVASSYIQRVIAIVALPRGNSDREQLEKPAGDVIRLALALECKSLREDREMLKSGKELPSDFCSYTPATWDAVVHRLNRGNLAVARAALVGVHDLIGLEKFGKGPDGEYTKGQSEFNGTFGKVSHLVCLMLERINDFSPTDLDELFNQPETATALVASLFSPDASTYDAGVNLIMTISSEVARREAIGHLFQSFFATTLNGFSWAVQRIAGNKTYTSCPRMLKTLQDVLDVLCNSQSGLLRTRNMLSHKEGDAVRHFWASQWRAFGVIYEMTEQWSRLKVDNNDAMKEFCRDTMQFSEYLFDQYSVFASALNAVPKSEQGEDHQSTQEVVGDHELLSHPASATQDVVKWLRLRDPYLASTSASLTQKILHRLSDAKIKIAEETVRFLEQVVRGTSTGKTNLTEQEKAETARALERNLGRAVLLVDTDHEKSDSSRAASVSRGSRTSSKSGNKIDFDKWNSKARPRIDLTTDEEDQSPVADPRVGELKGLQAYRASGLGSANRKLAAASKSVQHPTRPAKQDANQEAARVAFKEKRQKEIEAKKKRDAEMLAKMKSKGLGVEGKDHAPRGPSMMVSSSSDSDSQDDLDAALFGPAPKVSSATRDYHLSRLKAKQHQGPVKKARQARSAKDMRARLAPDLVALHRNILGWEYFHRGDFPPGTDRQNYSQVPDRFRTPLDYQQVFEPLLILEAWNGFLKSREESNIKAFTIKVANRMTVDSFLEVSTTMPIAEGQELGIAEADIVLLSKSQSPTASASQPHCLGRVHRITRKKAVMEISYRINPGSNLMSAMVPNATIYGARILSITPLEREYGALQGLKYFDLCDEVIQAKPSPLLQYPDQHLSPLVTNYNVNKAQAKAIKSAIDNDAFTLIQG